MRKLFYSAILLSLLIIVSTAAARAPQLVNYQGRLTDAVGTPIDGAYLVKFKIYGSASGTDSLWSSGFQTVTAANGLFNYPLGSGAPFPAGLFEGDTLRYLAITVGTDPEISPRVRFTASAYAHQAIWADTAAYAATIPNYSVTNLKLGTNSVTNTKMADNAVTTNEIANGTIVNADLNKYAAISTSKISGTAVNLTSTQTITGKKTFGDSAMVIDNNRVVIGQDITPSDTVLLLVNREIDKNDVSNIVYGVKCTLRNTGSANTRGGDFRAVHTGSAVNSYARGVYGRATSDGAYRMGLYGLGEAQDISLTTGKSYGVYATGYDGEKSYGIYAMGISALTNWAGYFAGNVHVTGTLSKAAGSFKIDHPLDPANKYLSHSFVESPDMMNVYNGNVILDSRGEAVVQMPDYFEALNRDFRYQLTCIGGFAPVYIAEEISGNSFIIAGGTTGLKISWQVTGVRQDPYAEANRIEVETDKPADEVGLYMHPEARGLSETMQIHYEQNRLMEEDGNKNSAGDR